MANAEKSFQRSFSKVIGQNEKGMFVLRSPNAFNNRQEQIRLRDNRLEISFIDNALTTRWNTPIVLPNTDGEIQDIQFLDDSLYIFYSVVNRNKSQNELYAVRLQLVNGQLSNEITMLDSIPYDKKKSKSMFYIRKSKNSKSLAIMYKYAATEEDKLSINIRVLDSTFNVKWSTRFKTDYFDGVLFLNDFKLTNDGRTFLLTSLDLEKKTMRDKKFSLFVADSSTSTFKTNAIGLQKYFINDIKMEIDYVNGQVIMAGFYSEMNSFSSAGLFYASLAFGSDNITIKTESFKAKFLNSFSNERTVNRGTELINYYVDKLVLRSDGGVILVAESNYITESTNYNSYYQLYTTSYTYHYDNILLFSVNPSGTVHWEGIVRKNQISEDDAAFYSSYILVLDADRISIIYNKYIRKSTDVMTCSISNKGEVTEKVLMKETEGVLIMPGGGKQISTDQVLIPCIQKNKSNFIRVTY